MQFFGQFGQKYRPFSYASVVGQDKVVKSMQNFIKSNTVPSVIGFIGATGCGKSTLARLLTMSINCQHPREDKESGFIEPCCECPSCKRMISENYSTGDVHVINGSDVTADKIRELEEIASYDPMIDNYTVILIEEAQTVKEMKRFLQITEVPRERVKWFLTSTDTAKFGGGGISYNKDNKSEEQKAMISRMTRFNIQPITTDLIRQKLFDILMEVDENGEVPETFLDEGLHIIAENAKNSMRLALNDMQNALSGECYTKEDVIALLGYVDEEKESAQVLAMLNKDPSALVYIQNSNDLSGNVPYWNKILVDARLREVTKIPCKEQWKEKSALAMIGTKNISALLNAFNKSTEMCSNYFNNSIFISCICDYYMSNSAPKVQRLVETKIETTSLSFDEMKTVETVPQATAPIKKIKKVVK